MPTKYFVDYLPITSDNKLTFYADGKGYCADLYKALTAAAKFVFLTGLHFMHDFELVRGGATKAGTTKLATVLAEVAERKVEVFLLVNQFWKDEHEIFEKKRKFIKQRISASGELWGYLPETFKLFRALSRYPNVHCRTDIHPNTYLFGTHHQKTIVIDDKIAFLGGVDLTYLDGDRWDTSAHNRDDRHTDRTQKFWHDIHMRVQGPAVQFVRDNFQQRWKYGRLHTLRLDGDGKIQADKDDARPTLPAFPKATTYTYPDGSETPDAPRVQIVRSMPATSTWQEDMPAWNKGRPKPKPKNTLTTGWQSVGERSCKDAYLIGLRAARRYIYLENQWVADEDIWEELAKAAKRNKDNKDFRIVVVIPYEPLFAAGLGSNQELWIGAEMEDVIDAARDEATFGVYSLVQREYREDNGQLDAEQQIYVHSKVLLVDDEWLMIGSANAGGISLEGLRYGGGASRPDTELSAVVLDKGFASAFRRTVWEEHLGRPVAKEYESRDADHFRRIAGTNDKKLRFFPGYQSIKRGVPSFVSFRPAPDWYSAAAFEKGSKLVPSFREELRWNLPPTLVPVSFTAVVVPSPPAGFRVWYRWKVELFFDKTSGKATAKTMDIRMRSLRYDRDEVYEYSDQEAAYIGARSARLINEAITADIAEARVRCRVQLVPLGEGPDPDNESFDSFVLSYELAFIEETLAKRNLPPSWLQ